MRRTISLVHASWMMAAALGTSSCGLVGGAPATPESLDGTATEGGGDPDASQVDDARVEPEVPDADAQAEIARHDAFKKSCVCLNCVEDHGAWAAGSRASARTAIAETGCLYVRRGFSPGRRIAETPPASSDDEFFLALRQTVTSTTEDQSEAGARAPTVAWEFELPSLVTENFVASLVMTEEENAQLNSLAQTYLSEFSGIDLRLDFDSVGYGHMDRWGDFGAGELAASVSRNSVPTLLTKDGWHYHLLLAARAIDAGAKGIFLSHLDERLNSDAPSTRRNFEALVSAIRDYAQAKARAGSTVNGAAPGGTEDVLSMGRRVLWVGAAPLDAFYAGQGDADLAFLDFTTRTLDTDVALGVAGAKYVRGGDDAEIACGDQSLLMQSEEARQNASGQWIGDLCRVLGDAKGHGRPFSTTVDADLDFETNALSSLPAFLELRLQQPCALNDTRGGQRRSDANVLFYENPPEDAETTCLSAVRNGMSGLMQYLAQPEHVRSTFAQSMSISTRRLRAEGVLVYYPQLLQVDGNQFAQLDENPYSMTDAQLATLARRLRLCPSEEEIELDTGRAYSGSDAVSVYNASYCGDIEAVKRALILADDPVRAGRPLSLQFLPGTLSLGPNESIDTRDFVLRLQQDGSLVLLRKGQATPVFSTWQPTNTVDCLSAPRCEALFSEGGALVVRKGTDVLWSSGTEGLGAIRFMVTSEAPYLRIVGRRTSLWNMPVDNEGGGEADGGGTLGIDGGLYDAGGNTSGGYDGHVGGVDSGSSGGPDAGGLGGLDAGGLGGVDSGGGSASGDDAGTAPPPPPVQCGSPAGGTMEVGENREFFSRASVAFGDSCSNYRRVRVCQANGQLSEDSSFRYAACATGTPSACALPWGGSLAHGASTSAYREGTVPYGGQCAMETRTCNNGTLSGSYRNDNCNVSPASGCALPWGGNISNGESRTAYQRSTVPFGEQCISETRVCNNGALSGSYGNPGCTVSPANGCALPWGGSISNGESRTAFQASSVSYGSSCVSETRTCNNGVLSGGFTKASCVVGQPASCTLPWGGSIAHGDRRTAYQASSVPYGASCVSEERVCDNGRLSGSYGRQSCVVGSARNCTLPWGGSIAHGEQRTAYQASSVPFGSTCVSEQRVCNDGTLSGSYSRASCTETAPRTCTAPWGGTLAHGDRVTAYSTSSVPYGSTCSTEERVCSNGTLSGSYRQRTCTVTPPRDCRDPWGRTLAHGASVTAYRLSSVPPGQQCQPEQRTCNNGSLSGSYTKETCTVQPSECKVYDWSYAVLATLASGQQDTFYIEERRPTSPNAGWETVCLERQVRCYCSIPSSCTLQERETWGWDLSTNNGHYYDNAVCAP
ncbi:MAG: hypothetical protein IPK13_19460 [Deltaproteobacteria bacterium]|nr:hypothetical protein [Deltaproteobacteria bacterium]